MLDSILYEFDQFSVRVNEASLWWFLLRSKFLGARIPYTRNTSASFQLDILVFGDIDPNPGPDHTKHDDHIKPKLVYNSEQLLSLNSYNGTGQSLPKLSTEVWRTITSLGINKALRSRPRGKRGGRRKPWLSPKSSLIDSNINNKIVSPYRKQELHRVEKILTLIT